MTLSIPVSCPDCRDTLRIPLRTRPEGKNVVVVYTVAEEVEACVNEHVRSSPDRHRPASVDPAVMEEHAEEHGEVGDERDG
jgi:hypothetical protein